VDVDLVSKSDFIAAFEVDRDVVITQPLKLVSKLRQLIAVLLSENNVTRVQIAIPVEVKHLEHELGLDDVRLLEEWLVKLIDEDIHVDTPVGLAFSQEVVQTCV